MIIDENGEKTKVSSAKVVAVDTTGAGDAFVGALAKELAEGKSLHEAALLRHALAPTRQPSTGHNPPIREKGVTARTSITVTMLVDRRPRRLKRSAAAGDFSGRVAPTIHLV